MGQSATFVDSTMKWIVKKKKPTMLSNEIW